MKLFEQEINPIIDERRSCFFDVCFEASLEDLVGLYFGCASAISCVVSSFSWLSLLGCGQMGLYTSFALVQLKVVGLGVAKHYVFHHF
jgi:hypothetical protein